MRALALALAFLIGGLPARAQTMGALGSGLAEEAEEDRQREQQPFFADPASIEDADYNLLLSNGYRFDSSHMLFAPGSDQPVTKGDYPFVLEELRSQKRLRALVQVNTILARNNFSKKLPKDDLEALRAAARENWGLLSKKTKGELMPFFHAAEIERMNVERPARMTSSPLLTALPVPPAAPAAGGTEALEARAPEPERGLRDVPRAPMVPVAGVALSLPRSARPRPGRAPREPSRTESYDAAQAAVHALRAAAEAGQAALAALDAARRVAPGDSLVMPMPAPWTAPAPKAAAAPAKPPAKAPPPAPAPKALPAPWAAEAPAAPAPAGAAPASLPAEAVVAALRAGVPPPSFPMPSAAAQAPTVVPPAPAAEAALAPAPAAAEPTPAPAEEPAAPRAVEMRPPRPQVSYPAFDPAAFAAFLESSPYSRDVRELLALVAKHSREPERHIALGVVTRHLPHILIDSQKTANRARAAIFRLPGETGLPGRYLVALGDGPVAVSRKRMIGSDSLLLMPDSPDFYRERGLPVPGLKAFSRENAADKEEDGPLGRERRYSDGSVRLRYSPSQLAGSLIKQLMTLDAALRGWDSDVLHVELRSWAAQFRFYRSLAIDSGKEPPLDADLAVRFREWHQRPEDHVDFVAQTLSAPREAAWLPSLSGDAQARYDAQRRAELEAARQAGLFESGEMARLIERLPAPKVPEPLPHDPSSAAGDPDAEAAWLLQEHDARAKP